MRHAMVGLKAGLDEAQDIMYHMAVLVIIIIITIIFVKQIVKTLNIHKFLIGFNNKYDDHWLFH